MPSYPCNDTIQGLHLTHIIFKQRSPYTLNHRRGVVTAQAHVMLRRLSWMCNGCKLAVTLALTCTAITTHLNAQHRSTFRPSFCKAWAHCCRPNLPLRFSCLSQLYCLLFITWALEKSMAGVCALSGHAAASASQYAFAPVQAASAQNFACTQRTRMTRHQAAREARYTSVWNLKVAVSIRGVNREYAASTNQQSRMASLTAWGGFRFSQRSPAAGWRVESHRPAGLHGVVWYYRVLML